MGGWRIHKSAVAHRNCRGRIHHHHGNRAPADAQCIWRWKRQRHRWLLPGRHDGAAHSNGPGRLPIHGMDRVGDRGRKPFDRVHRCAKGNHSELRSCPGGSPDRQQHACADRCIRGRMRAGILHCACESYLESIGCVYPYGSDASRWPRHAMGVFKVGGWSDRKSTFGCCFARRLVHTFIRDGIPVNPRCRRAGKRLRIRWVLRRAFQCSVVGYAGARVCLHGMERHRGRSRESGDPSHGWSNDDDREFCERRGCRHIHAIKRLP